MNISSIEIYNHNEEERIARTWGTTAPGLPYVEEAITNAGNWLIGGDLEVIEPIKYNDSLDRFQMSPAELREEFTRHNADAVFAFQLRNPVHNGHALLMTDTRRRLLEMGYKNPVLLLHPLGGYMKADDVPHSWRMKQHEKAELGFVPGVPFRAVFGSWISGGKGKVMGKGSGRRCSYPETTVVSIFPSPMHYVGSAQQKCSGMQRVGSMRGPTFRSWVGTQLVAAYDKTQGKMAFFDPSRSQDFLFISGTKMRALAKSGENPPDGLCVPVVGRCW
ncbi:hypothetical protein RHMOL_Rhmol02G0032000 [Rhododendron molle]|uniref:Uncharacterized protein n=1 Tax=Rhododendron molle TaxID=49168 RepID=A0ACC0PMG4_RHOML|nr:hypothetical protein RHMOL_Rhmol02G0032000 [Rhododendron molle]